MNICKKTKQKTKPQNKTIIIVIEMFLSEHKKNTTHPNKLIVFIMLVCGAKAEFSAEALGVLK